ncbi:MAG: hypothetical protein M3P82_07150 [Bacteroidota bacterium]|nr:hypothetical protein [Bacteroidota bacterium]
MSFHLSSCSKKETVDDRSNTSGENEAQVTVLQDDFKESNEDLFTVDYKDFYDELSNHGKWIQVNGEDLGLNIDKGTAYSKSNLQEQLSYLITGVKNAYADEADAFFIWQPSSDLSVSIGTEETDEYIPYTNGQWTNTDAGWYFKAPTAAEEITSHFGRWIESPSLGWTWIPGRVWAPAWVEWRENDEYLAWAPLPPATYITNDIVSAPIIDDDKYVIVEKKYFAEPSVYKYMYKENRNKVIIKEMSKINGVMIRNKTVINKGPEPSLLEKNFKQNVEIFRINKVSDRNKVKINGKEINVLAPEFRKIKINSKTKKTKPVSFVNFTDANLQNNNRPAGEEERKKNDKEDIDDKDKVFGNDKKDNKFKDKSDKKNWDKSTKENERDDEKGDRKIKDNEKRDESGKKNKGKSDDDGDKKEEEKKKSDGNSNKKEKK